ncbi:MAG: DUF2017 family protein [Actinomycetaceae bacterium]|nr:DUF2017 domain-containing protein [Arcanobacterium sp.]MDD7504719.1 DUF2017 family protein [Actinomycetaceae bacterium]MDY6143106.1 DUF2017 family protein [Arcanobacterium sp.]
MMGFQATRGGYITSLNNQERGFLAGLARDVIYMLGSDAERELEMREEELFEQLERELAGIEDAIDDDADERFYSAMTDPMRLDDAIARLLPDMSEEPDLADDLRKLTEDGIAQEKIERLTTFYAQIKPEGFEAVYDDDGFGEELDPNSPEMRKALQSRYFFLKNGDELVWMGALNDIRLVLSARLDITDDASAERVAERASRFTSTDPHTDGGDLPLIEEQDDMLAVMYMMTSWWLDTLSASLLHKQHRRYLRGEK